MEAAKASVKSFLSRSGHHDTTVHRKVAPAVQDETVIRKEHEETTTALQKEIHQTHYHTKVQPIHHSETLPEQHHHNLLPVERKHFEHDDENEIKRSLDEERAQFKDTSKRVEGDHTTETVPVVEGVHVHHHVHEQIQPVIYKRTIEPHVVHTTVPIHEVHHNKSQHHGASRMPSMTMEDFLKSGGNLKGGDEKHEFYSGDPSGLNITGLDLHGSDKRRDSGIGSMKSGSSSRGSMDSTTRPHRNYPLNGCKHGP